MVVGDPARDCLVLINSFRSLRILNGTLISLTLTSLDTAVPVIFFLLGLRCSRDPKNSRVLAALLVQVHLTDAYRGDAEIGCMCCQRGLIGALQVVSFSEVLSGSPVATWILNVYVYVCGWIYFHPPSHYKVSLLH